MSSGTIIETPVDDAKRAKADAVLERLGLTLGEAVAILIDRIAEDGDLPVGLATDRFGHDAWVATEVLRALADDREPHSDPEMKAYFARRRDDALERLRPEDE